VGSAVPQNGLGVQVAVKKMVESDACDESIPGSIEMNALEKGHGDLMYAT
jgi:hypothetical protein